MSVTAAQGVQYATGSGTTFSVTLGSAPTPGNVMVVTFASPFLASGPTLSGWTAGYVPGGLSSSDVAVMYRVVQSGDTAGPYTFAGNQNANCWVASIVELAGAGPTPAFTYLASNVAWAQLSTSEPSPNLAALAGSYSFFLFTIASGSVSVTNLGDSMSSGTYIQSKVSANGSQNEYAGFGIQLFASPGTASATFTAPGGATVVNSTQTSMIWNLAPTGTSGSTGNGPSANVIGNNGGLPPMYPIPPALP